MGPVGTMREPRGNTRARMRKTVWWASWGIDSFFVVLGLLFAPVVAIVAFSTGESGTGWAALGVFVSALAYGLALAFDLVGRDRST